MTLATALTLCTPLPALPQRSRQPAPSSPLVLSPALGSLLQPESVKSILVLYLARTMTKAKAAELEAELKKTPEKLEDRLSLIGYYNWNAQTTADRSRLRTHVLWVIANHPEHPAVAESSLRDLLDDPEGNVLIMDLWQRNMATRGNEVDVMKNAEKFFFSKDPAQAEQLIQRLFARDPGNPEWAGELAKLYSLFGIPGFASDIPGDRAVEGYRRVLELTRNPSARQALAGDMADTEFKAGEYAGAAKLAEIHRQGTDRSANQRAHTILGRVALRNNDLPAARQHLLASATAADARYIAAFSPTMILAKELLAQGEKETVLQYLENCVPLWPRGEGILQIWITDIHNGKTPDFGNQN